MNFCAKCGRERAGDARYCGGCGTELDAAPAAAATAPADDDSAGGDPQPSAAVEAQAAPAPAPAEEAERWEPPADATRVERPPDVTVIDRPGGAEGARTPTPAAAEPDPFAAWFAPAALRRAAGAAVGRHAILRRPQGRVHLGGRAGDARGGRRRVRARLAIERAEHR